MCMAGGSGGAAAAQRAEASRRQEEIRKGTEEIDKNFGRFGDGFFDRSRRDYLDYTLPQAHRQFKDAHGNTLAHLARSGQLNTSAGANKLADLFEARELARGNIASKAEEFANQHRQQVNQEKRSLISALNASGDASQAANLSANAAVALANAPAIDPLGNLFSNFTALGALDAQSKRAGEPGLFGGGSRTPKSSLGIVT